MSDYSFLRGKTITLDCNVFILLVIGSIGKEHIKIFKRTSMFSENDFDLLIKLIKNSYIMMTPNVLTEASNLLESYNYAGNRIGLKALSKILNSTGEVYIKSSELVLQSSYIQFGLADSSIHDLCRKGVVAVTVDLPLYGYLANKSLNVINFNHLRANIK